MGSGEKNNIYHRTNKQIRRDKNKTGDEGTEHRIEYLKWIVWKFKRQCQPASKALEMSKALAEISPNPLKEADKLGEESQDISGSHSSNKYAMAIKETVLM